MISNIRLVPNVVWFLLGNSSASEFYTPTFWNTLSVLLSELTSLYQFRFLSTFHLVWSGSLLPQEWLQRTNSSMCLPLPLDVFPSVTSTVSNFIYNSEYLCLLSHVLVSYVKMQSATVHCYQKFNFCGVKVTSFFPPSHSQFTPIEQDRYSGYFTERKFGSSSRPFRYDSCNSPAHCFKTTYFVRSSLLKCSLRSIPNS